LPLTAAQLEPPQHLYQLMGSALATSNVLARYLKHTTYVCLGWARCGRPVSALCE